MQLAHCSSILRSISAACLLLALGGVLLVAQSPPPDCVPGPLKTLPAYYPDGSTPYPGITARAPQTYVSCPTNGCCDTFRVIGVPSGLKVTGTLVSSFVFTTKCVNGVPAYPPLGRLTIQELAVDRTSTGADILIKICYPKVHEWPSFETHVDVFLDVLDAAGTKVAIIGPGTDWDTYCTTVGCTPGKWKNWTGLGTGNQTNLWPLPYLPASSTYYEAFGRYYTGSSSLTMLQALNLGGSGENGMARHCTAALLNARWTELKPWLGNNCEVFAGGTPDVSDVIGWVRNAYDKFGGETFASAMNKCAKMNESLCALDGVWMNTHNGVSECAEVNPGTPCAP